MSAALCTICLQVISKTLMFAKSAPGTVLTGRGIQAP